MGLTEHLTENDPMTNNIICEPQNLLSSRYLDMRVFREIWGKNTPERGNHFWVTTKRKENICSHKSCPLNNKTQSDKSG